MAALDALPPGLRVEPSRVLERRLEQARKDRIARSLGLVRQLRVRLYDAASAASELLVDLDTQQIGAVERRAQELGETLASRSELVAALVRELRSRPRNLLRAFSPKKFEATSN